VVCMRRQVAVCLFLLGSVIAAAGQQQEQLLFQSNAYDPVPSPDGRLVAYLHTGRNTRTGGFGRSSLQSDVWFCDPSGQTLQSSRVEGFLGEWLPDSGAIVTFRDHRVALVDSGGSRDSESMGRNDEDLRRLPERVAYLSKLDVFIWLQQSDSGTVLQSKNGPVTRLKNQILPEGGLIVPSPDERYLAIGGPTPDERLWVYDTVQRTLTDFGKITIHPDPDWDYIKPSWNPWFADGKHLAFFSGSNLYVTSPDGKERRRLLNVADGGLATPSPDGTMVAYATYSSRPRRLRKDLNFWGASALWIVPSAGGVARQITEPSEDETYDLRWLTKDSLIFDRISEGLFNEHARIWTVSIGNQ
jgi:hypothetical protein